MVAGNSANTFHEEAAKRIHDASQDILSNIAVIDQLATRQENNVELHPTHKIDPSEIISLPTFSFLSDWMGQVAGVVWLSAGKQVGWIGPAFQKIETLVNQMETSGPFKGLVSRQFLQEKTCEWLRESLERTRTDSLSPLLQVNARKVFRTTKFGFHSSTHIH
jgi:hypothetical protein